MVDPDAASFQTPDAASMNPLAARPDHPVPVRDMPRPDTYRAMVDPDAASFQTPDAASMAPLAARPRHAVPVRDVGRVSGAGRAAEAQKGMPFRTPDVKTPDRDAQPIAADRSAAAAAQVMSPASPAPPPTEWATAAVTRARPVGARVPGEQEEAPTGALSATEDAQPHEPRQPGAPHRTRMSRSTLAWTVGGVLLLAAAVAWAATRPEFERRTLGQRTFGRHTPGRVDWSGLDRSARALRRRANRLRERLWSGHLSS